MGTRHDQGQEGALTISEVESVLWKDSAVNLLETWRGVKVRNIQGPPVGSCLSFTCPHDKLAPQRDPGPLPAIPTLQGLSAASQTILT